MENESVDRIYEQAVQEKPIYNVSNYIFYNYGSVPGGVLVQNDKKQNTTIASGYYLITGLPNGAYNLSFPKAGFNTGYLNVTINNTNNSIGNTIYNDSYNSRAQGSSILNVKAVPRSDKK